jgi:modification methylase
MITCTERASGTVPAGPPLAVWATGQRSLAAQLAGRYLPATAACGRILTPALARQLVDSFTRPGDLVADPVAGPGVLLVEAGAAGRRCAGLAGSQAEADLARANSARALTPRQCESIRLRQGDERHIHAHLDDCLGQVQLAATRLPEPAGTGGGLPASGVLGTLRGPAYEAALSQLLAGCAAILHPEGTLAVVTTSPVTNGVLTDLPGLVVRVAARVGLAYIQHIIAITALIRDSRLLPYLADGVLAPLGPPRDHLDVLVFARKGSR